MFRFLAKDRSHRQRLELHTAMAAAASPQQPEAPSAMEEDIPTPAAMPRRKSVQLNEFERPSHRPSAAVGEQQTAMQGAQGAPSGGDLAGMYALHNDPSRRRSSLDCIRSARRSGTSVPRANGPFGAESSVEARPAELDSQCRGSDSEDEVSSGPGGGVQSRPARRHQQSNLAQQAQHAQQAHQSRRNPFEYEMEDAQLVPERGYPAAGNAQRGYAGNSRYYAGGCGRTAEQPSSQGERFCDMAGWGGMDQAMHPAGLMQARAAMVAQGRSSINQGNTFPDMM